MLSWHVRKLVTIWWPAAELQQGEVSIEFKFRQKSVSETGPWDQHTSCIHVHGSEMVEIMACCLINQSHTSPCSISHSADFCSEWCIVGYGTGALWYLWIRSIAESSNSQIIDNWLGCCAPTSGICAWGWWVVESNQFTEFTVQLSWHVQNFDLIELLYIYFSWKTNVNLYKIWIMNR